jgi:threonine dehydrogenase-like Zn-dependent dehydrogenase
MKAAMIVGPEQAEIVRTPAPAPEPGEMVVRLEGCGVCTSNLPLWEGREWFNYPAPPGAPGHEGWGRVHALGAGVRGFQVGDRVTFLSHQAYAEYDRAPAGAAVKLPAALDALPFPGESIGCAMNVFRRSEVSAGQTVAVVGAGFLGIIFIALAAQRGARVIALSRRSFALELAAAYGAAETILLDDHQRVLDRVRELSGGVGCDRVLEATGHQWPLDLAGEMVRERGKVIIAGFHQDGPRQVNLQLWNWKGIDVINAHERDTRLYLAGIHEAIQAVVTGQLSLAGLITHQFDLEQVALAYQTLALRPDGFIKGVIRL